MVGKETPNSGEATPRGGPTNASDLFLCQGNKSPCLYDKKRQVKGGDTTGAWISVPVAEGNITYVTTESRNRLTALPQSTRLNTHGAEGISQLSFAR